MTAGGLLIAFGLSGVGVGCGEAPDVPSDGYVRMLIIYHTCINLLTARYGTAGHLGRTMPAAAGIITIQSSTTKTNNHFSVMKGSWKNDLRVNM